MDHGTYEQALSAIEGGFSSVMFDGSKYPIAENIEKTKRIISLCAARGLRSRPRSARIGGERTGISPWASAPIPGSAKLIADLGVDMLAAGIGNIHGKYPANGRA